jgi:putative hydrolase
MGGMAFGSQLGQALGKLAREVLTSTDIGLPLGPKGVAALMPEAIESLAEGLELPRSEIITFLAAREAAHHRLFSHVPWLSSQLLNAVEASPGTDRHEQHPGLRRGFSHVADDPSDGTATVGH